VREQGLARLRLKPETARHKTQDWNTRPNNNTFPASRTLVAASRRLLPFLQTCTCGWKPQPRSLCAFATPALHREWGMNSRSDSPIRISFARAARRYGLCPQVFMVPAVLLRVTEATEFQNPISGLSGFQRPQCFISSDSPIGLRHAKETVLGRMPGPLWRGRPVRRHTCPRKQGGFRGVAVTNRRHGPDRSEGAGKERGGGAAGACG
jgi:hypothetical protein